jgi:uncharacterized protein (DUF1697 family)
MPRYIALLRAINVGGHTVKMDRLRALFEELELANVTTFIASGNVIFESAARKTGTLEQKIEKHLKESLGYAVDTFIRSAAEIAAVAGHKPFSADLLDMPGSSLYILFLRDAATDVMRKRLNDLRSETDDFHTHGREIYWWSRGKMSESPLFTGTRLEKAVGVSSTMRNSTTVRKMAAKYNDR